MVAIVSTAVWYIWKLLRQHPKNFHHKEKFYFSYLYQVVDIKEIYYGNLFATYISQIIIPYTLNLYSTVCQLYLNKNGIKNK